MLKGTLKFVTLIHQVVASKMYYIELHIRIQQIVKFYHLFGIFQIEDESTRILQEVALKFLYLCCAVSYVTLLALGGLFCDDKSESIFLISMSVADVVVTVKLTYILWKNDEIRRYLLDLGTYSFEDLETFKKVNEKQKTFKKFSATYLWLIVVSYVGLCVCHLPVFSSDRRLPADIWFPFDWKNNETIYWIAYAYVVIANLIHAISITFKVVLWYLMMNCAIKYQILGNLFSNMHLTMPCTSTFSKAEEENLFLQKLIDLIKTHQTTQKTVKSFKSCFEILFFTQITTSGLCICGSVYVMAFGTLDENLIQPMLYTSLLIYNIFDIFMIMYLGNEIKLSSDRLSYNLFESYWIEQSKSRKKCIIILTEVFKHPQELVVGKLYPLDMETFISIVKMAYSMFNVLQNLK